MSDSPKVEVTGEDTSARVRSLAKGIVEAQDKRADERERAGYQYEDKIELFYVATHTAGGRITAEVISGSHGIGLTASTTPRGASVEMELRHALVTWFVNQSRKYAGVDPWRPAMDKAAKAKLICMETRHV